MGIEVTIHDVRSVGEELWEVSLSPRDIRSLGACNSNAGAVSIMLLKVFRFDGTQGAVSFSPDSVIVLNVGTTSRTVIIAAGSPNSAMSERGELGPLADAPATLGSGDQQFLRTLDDLPDEVKEAGEAILTQVRLHFPGDLRAVSARRFKETPDNFWFITIQPRDRSLSITVRGLPERFSTVRLRVVEDRRPYSRFKVTSMADVSEAVGVIRNAVRKGV